LVLSAHHRRSFVRRAGIGRRVGPSFVGWCFSLGNTVSACLVVWNSLLRAKAAGIPATVQELWHSLFLAKAGGVLLLRQAAALVLRVSAVGHRVLALAKHGRSGASAGLPWGGVRVSASAVLARCHAILSTLGAQPGTQPDLAHKAAQVRLVLR
jgi:hypothetical protein